MSSTLVYKASAGSGKTFTLAIHYIKLLVLAESPREYARILAVTFTKKATGEMKDRILSQLFGIGAGLASSDNYLAALRKSIAADGLDVPDDEELRRRCREALHQILHDYNSFRVQTIDSFFQIILRGLAHELGLAANLQVEISDSEVLSQAVDRLVDRLQDDKVLLNWMMSLVRDQIENNQRWDVTRAVKAFGRVIFKEDFIMRGERLRLMLADDKAFTAFIEELRSKCAEGEKAISALGDAIYDLVESRGITFEDFSNGSTLRSAAEKLRAVDTTFAPGKRLTDWAYDPLTLLTKANRASRPDLLEAADEMSGLLAEVLQSYARLAHDVVSARLVLAHIKKLRLLGDIEKEVTALNAENNRFNLAKTPVLLHEMIGESDAPFVFEKIGALLRHVIIDEFQDTSHLQWLNFQTLLIETIAKGGHNLIVGDVKQSIYRFRGGDWRMLGSIESAMQPAPVVRTLDTNFRSSRQVIDFNNAFFEQAVVQMDQLSASDIELLAEDFTFAKAYADVHQEVPAKRDDSGYVRLTTLPSATYQNKTSWLGVVLDDLIAQVKNLSLQGLPYNEMTILVRNNYEAEPIIGAFAAEADMPAIISDEAFLLASSEAVEALIAALRVVTDESDVVSPFFLSEHYPDVDAIDEELRRQLLQMPLYEALETLCRRYCLNEISGQQAYLAAFFDAVQDFIHTETSDIESFLVYWDERLSKQSVPASAVDGIRIMTIHGAKGMEFHTVFIPFCTWQLESDRSGSLLWCAPDEEPYASMGLLPVSPQKGIAQSAFAKDYAREHLYSRLDELNVLYVAFTRARDNLYVWAVGDESKLGKAKNSVGDLVAAVYPSGFESGTPVVEAKSDDTEADNRLLPVREQVDVPFVSYDSRAEYRQSNRSQQFVAQAQLDDDAAEEEYSRQQQYIELGSLLHGVLQQMTTAADMERVLSQMEHEGVITKAISDGIYVSVQRADVEQWLRRGLSNPKVGDWFSGRWQVFNECAIVSRNDDSAGYLNKRPDRVMLSADESRIVVVDFKFGRKRGIYIEQVQKYMELLQEMYPDASVEGYLWFVYSGRVEAVSAKGAKAVDTSQLELDF